MKKAIMMIALLAVPFAMQAQTKFHDVEVNEATGPVKSISTSFMGQNQVTNFTQDGKMENGMTDAVYDADGYLQSAKREMRGEKIPVTFKWENGRKWCCYQSKHRHGRSGNGHAIQRHQV